MKDLLAVCITLFFMGVFWGCLPRKEFQIELNDVKLVRVDTLWRSQGINWLQLTWENRSHRESYISYQPLEYNPFFVGMCMQIFRIK